jgi:hypothetical protein
MTKLRTPDTIEEAVMQTRVLLGDAKVCEVTGRRITLVKAWSDPDDDKRTLPFRAAKLLDRELMLAGHEPLFRRLLERDGDVAPADSAPADPLDQAMNFVTGAAGTLQATREALKNRTVEPHERVTLLARATDMQRALGAFKRSLFVKPSARR